MSNVSVSCALIVLFVKRFDNLDFANKVFDEMLDKIYVIWTLMINTNEFFMDAIDMFLNMMIYILFKFRIIASWRQLHNWVVNKPHFN